MRENLVFALRAEREVFPLGVMGGEYYASSYAGDFMWSGLHSRQAGVDPLKPYRDNHRFRNFCYAPSPVLAESGFLATGAYLDLDAWLWFGDLWLVEPAMFQLEPFHQPGSAPPALLGYGDSRWIYSRLPCHYYYDTSHQGFLWYAPHFVSTHVVDEQLRWLLEADAVNPFGLPYLSTMLAENMSGQLRVAYLPADGSVLLENDEWVYFYPEVENPVLQNVGYYFADPNQSDHSLPGDSGFTVTNTTPLLITSVGDPYFNVAGYAKLAILNGYSNKFAYLGQYFDKAYRATPDGTRSTNETGFLSPYGYFFPTEPGRTILTTMPDGVSTNVGECTVHVIGLNVDANHDGNMDLSFTGPDQTSEQRPFVFWVNNDFDRMAYDKDDDAWYADDVERAGSALNPKRVTPDFDYRDHDGNRAIPTMRDLEDFARLWINGVDSTILDILPATTTVTLSWGDEANPNPANPTIDLFAAYESGGGMGYLTNSAVALLQTFLPASELGSARARVRESLSHIEGLRAGLAMVGVQP